MGVDDARSMQRYFVCHPGIRSSAHAQPPLVIGMTIGRKNSPAFPPFSLNCRQTAMTNPHIIERSRTQYAVSRDYVDRYVGERFI